MALLWDDLDLEAQTLTINKSAGQINGEKVTQLKTANSVRTIYPPQKTTEVSREYRANQPGTP